MMWRRDTSANFNAVNPILMEGEWAYETDTKRYKMGDGVNHYADLIFYQAQVLDELLTTEIPPIIPAILSVTGVVVTRAIFFRYSQPLYDYYISKSTAANPTIPTATALVLLNLRKTDNPDGYDNLVVSDSSPNSSFNVVFDKIDYNHLWNIPGSGVNPSYVENNSFDAAWINVSKKPNANPVYGGVKLWTPSQRAITEALERMESIIDIFKPQENII